MIIGHFLEYAVAYLHFLALNRLVYDALLYEIIMMRKRIIFVKCKNPFINGAIIDVLSFYGFHIVYHLVIAGASENQKSISNSHSKLIIVNFQLKPKMLSLSLNPYIFFNNFLQKT